MQTLTAHGRMPLMPRGAAVTSGLLLGQCVTGCSWLVVPALNREREQAAMGTEGGEFVVEVSLVLPIGIQFAVRVLAVLRHSAIVGMHETVERRRRPAQGLW